MSVSLLCESMFRGGGEGMLKFLRGLSCHAYVCL